MTPNQPLTIGTLRDGHLSLMRGWRDLESDEERLRRASDLRQTASGAGQSIESPAERDEAQGIIDYWASAIAALPGQSYPELLSVAQYARAQALTAGKTVRDVYESLQPPEAQRLARSILEDLLVLGESGVERDKPRNRQALRKSAGTEDSAMFDRVLDALVETGAIVRRPGETPADDCFEAADSHIADSWPALNEWLAAARTYDVERVALMKQAEQWLAADKNPALLLLTSGAVDKALTYKNEDSLLDGYIDASHSSRTRLRRWVQGLSVVALLVLGSAVVFLFFLLKDAERERSQARKERAEAEKRMAKAELRADQLLRNAAHTNRQAQANAEIAQQPELSTREFAKIAQGMSPAADAQSDAALERLPALSGAMWLGSDAAPQVADLRGRKVGGFARAVPGTRYRARIPIYLREAMPKSNLDYASPREKAVIPASAQIVLLGSPRGYKRDTGTQYWANVRIVPQVYVQYNNANRADVDRVRRLLAAAGFEVPRGELRRDFRNRAEVRFFQQGDRPIAALLQQTLNVMPQFASFGRVDCRSFVGSPYIGANFKLEFWYDGRHKAGANPRPCA